MKRIRSTLAIIFTILFGWNAFAAADHLSGRVVFSADYKQEYLAQRGYQFVAKGNYGQYPTNYFGAPKADVTIKNAKGEIVGVGTTGPDGAFVVQVEPSNFYQVSVQYKGRKLEKTFSSADAAKGITLDVGRFE